MPTGSPDTATGALLERFRELSTLGAFLDDAKETSRGRFVFLAGEAGIGKTALLRELSANCRRGTRVLWGGCDPMVTPQPLAPLLDIAEAAGGETAALVTAGAKPHPIAAALLRELAAPAPTLLVIEDLHWADEATLDVLGLLARRIGGKPVLVVASYRDDALDRRGPLRVLLGELATAPDVMRMPLAPLSRKRSRRSPHHTGSMRTRFTKRPTGTRSSSPRCSRPRRSRSRPLCATPFSREPRASAPGPGRLLDAAAVLVPPVEIAILNALLPHGDGELEECLAAGMLVATGGAVAFRHELSRLALERSLSPDVRVAPPQQGACGLGGQTQPSRRGGAPGPSRRGGARCGRGSPLRAGSGAGRRRGRRPSRGGRAVRSRAALR